MQAPERTFFLWAVAGFVGWASGFAFIAPVDAASVLMISVDGMKPEYVTQAAAHGLQIPFLRSLITDGAYAEGVVGVWPANTYPSHTTMLTGVRPAEHGIYNNVEFDPRHTYADSWFWYARQIRVPTLWDIARQSGLRTASVGWPVSVGAPVDFLIPEYWRVFRPTADLNPADRYLIAALSRPQGLLEAMEAHLGPYLMGNDTSRDADETKTRFAEDILQRSEPRFMTVHLSSLDEAEHEHGPSSAEANQDLEAIDGMVSRLAAVSRALDPAAILVVVSDHGFVPLTHRVNLNIPFIQAGLIEQAQPWLASGMAAIMLRDPADQRNLQQVRQLLHKLAADSRYGIADVLERQAIAALGAFPGASFLVVMKPGYGTGSASSGEVVEDVTGHGGHGFAPSYPEMRSAFFITGAGIARHRDLGLVDMRQIAPTVAQMLNLPMPSAKASALPVRQ